MRFLPFILCIACVGAFAQSTHPILRDFYGRQVDNGIELTWVIKGGNTCQGAYIQRFEADSFFMEIGEYDGVCGSTLGDESYTFTDTAPLLNQTNYYRLELGQQGFTNVIQVDYYKYNDKGYIILGNPMIEQTEIVFENTSGNAHDIALYDMGGNLIMQKPTDKDRVTLYNLGLPAGIYLFVIKEGEQALIKGKILVMTD